MTSIIWFVQVVHYPLFSRVGASGFPAYSEAHSRLTAYVVGPPILIEAATAVLLVVVRSIVITVYLVWSGLVLLAVVWLSTALFRFRDTRSSGWRSTTPNGRASWPPAGSARRRGAWGPGWLWTMVAYSMS